MLAVGADLVPRAEPAGGDCCGGVRQRGDGCLRRVLDQQVYVVVLPVVLHQGRAEVLAGFDEHLPQVGGVFSGEYAMPVSGHEGQVGMEGGNTCLPRR